MTFTCDDILGTTVVLWKGQEQLTLYTILILVPPVVFLLFLLFKLRSSLRILRETAVDVRLFRVTTLSFLWTMCLSNIARMAVQVLVPPTLDVLWKVLWLITRIIMMFLQLAVIVFVIMLIWERIPFTQIIGGVRIDRVAKQALVRTAIVSALLAVADCVLQAVLIFVLDQSIYDTDGGEPSIYWIARALAFIVLYMFILFALYFIYPRVLRARYEGAPAEKLWSLRMLYFYCALMLALSVLELVGWCFLLRRIDAGVCIIGFSIMLYYSLYPPLVYLTFMHKFFKTAEHWPLKFKADEARHKRQLEREEKRKLRDEAKKEKEKEREREREKEQMRKESRNNHHLPLHLQVDSVSMSSSPASSIASSGSGYALRDVLSDYEDET